MTITLDDIQYVKSSNVTDLATNGGAMGDAVIISGAKHNLFPRVPKTERVNGVTRKRKKFLCNFSEPSETAYGVLQWIDVPSNAGDRYYIAAGTHTDTQANIDTPASGDVVIWVGGGYLNANLSGGETSIDLSMENNDYVFPNGGTLHISNKITTGTVDNDVVIGDSVTYSSGTWSKISATSDIEYPNGVFIGINNVFTLQSSTNEEWLTIAENLYSGENIGTGNDTVSPSLSTLTNKTNGICQISGKEPIISSQTAANATLTVYLNQDGSVDSSRGDGVSGQLNMVDGTWTTPITWGTAPGNSKAITITYREKPYSYYGNIATISLTDQVGNAYISTNTTASACISTAELAAKIDSVVFTSSGGTFSGTFTPYNSKAIRDTITITFTGGAAYNIAGTSMGDLGSGAITSTKIVKHPITNLNLFSIPNTGWGGTITAGDSIVFELYPSSTGLWVKEVVPSGTAVEPNNLCIFGFYME